MIIGSSDKEQLIYMEIRLEDFINVIKEVENIKFIFRVFIGDNLVCQFESGQ